MRFASDDCRGVLSGPSDNHWVGDLHYNGVRVLEGVPLSNVSLTESATAAVQQSGSVTVAWSDEFATSLTPQFVSDPLAPFGAQLHIFSVISAGSFSERVAFGQFEITDVPSARDEQMKFRGEWITAGSMVDLEIDELLSGIGEESFDVPTAPQSLDSTWAEVQRITGLPLSRTVPDSAITRSIMYPESRLQAVYELMSVMLDAVPHLTAYGALGARPNAWPAPVSTLELGCVVTVGAAMSAEGVKNRVVVRSPGGDAPSVLASAEITSGPLRVREPDGSVSPFRARTRYLSSEYVATEEQAKPWADSTLAQVSTLRTRVVPITETFNPLRERGDVILVERPTEYLLCRVVTISRARRGSQDLTVEVAGSMPRQEPGEVFPELAGG